MGICPWLCAHRPVTPPWLWRLFLIALPIWLRQWVFCPRMSHPDHDNSTSQTHSPLSHGSPGTVARSFSHTDTHTRSERDRDFKRPFVLPQTSSHILHSHTFIHVPSVPAYSVTNWLEWVIMKSTLFYCLEKHQSRNIHSYTFAISEDFTYADFGTKTDHIVQIISSKFNAKTNTFDINTYIRY